MSEAEKLIEEISEQPKNLANWYNKNYKVLLIIPIILLILSLGYLGYAYYTTGDFIEKDISLTGGTSITIFVQEQINTQELKDYLSQKK